jgi:hypothetical protein
MNYAVKRSLSTFIPSAMALSTSGVDARKKFFTAVTGFDTTQQRTPHENR